MDLKDTLIYFFTGGIVTTLIVFLESSGLRLLSGFVTLLPVFTLVSYIFIGDLKGGQAVAEHAWFVLVGTIVSWIPYMIAVAYLSPRIGSQKAIGIGLILFLILVLIFLTIVNKYSLFSVK